jgi:hypothetical protein
MRTIFGIALLCMALTCCGCQKAVEQSPDHPVWQSNSDVSPKLTETFQSIKFPPKFVMKMPTGYQLSMREEANRKMDMFYGPIRQDKTRAIFMVNVLDAKQGRKDTASLGESMKLAVDGIKSGRSAGWKNGKWEDGTISGLHFMRLYWAGQEPTTKQMMHGFIYGTTVGDEFFEFAAQDLAKYDSESMPALEGAVQTFKLER